MGTKVFPSYILLVMNISEHCLLILQLLVWVTSRYINILSLFLYVKNLSNFGIIFPSYFFIYNSLITYFIFVYVYLYLLEVKLQMRVIIFSYNSRDSTELMVHTYVMQNTRQAGKLRLISMRGSH